MLNRIIIIFGAILGIFTLGFFRGKNSEKNKINKNILKNVKEIKKREINRRNDSIDTVRKRLSKYIRR